MRVMCIRKTTIQKGCTPIVIGNFYTIVAANKYDYGTYYELEEMPSNCEYRDNLFAPLSDLDETIIHNKKEEYAAV